MHDRPCRRVNRLDHRHASYRGRQLDSNTVRELPLLIDNLQPSKRIWIRT